MTGDLDKPPVGSRAALAVLVALAVLSPWAFGSVDPLPTQAIALILRATQLHRTVRSESAAWRAAKAL